MFGWPHVKFYATEEIQTKCMIYYKNTVPLRLIMLLMHTFYFNIVIRSVQHFASKMFVRLFGVVL